jgi:hypothetical protein
MLAKIDSAAVYGVDACEVEIEANGAHWYPKMIVVGLRGYGPRKNPPRKGP